MAPGQALQAFWSPACPPFVRCADNDWNIADTGWALVAGAACCLVFQDTLGLWSIQAQDLAAWRMAAPAMHAEGCIGLAGIVLLFTPGRRDCQPWLILGLLLASVPMLCMAV